MIGIRDFQPADYDPYIKLCQRVFQATYAAPGSGVPKQLFSLGNFRAASMDEHFRALTARTDNNSTWVAESNGRLVGCISLTHRQAYDEARGFYVDLKFQGQGIGTLLWNHMLRSRHSRCLELEVFRHAYKTIAMYEKWGFRPQPVSTSYIHWDEWPKECVLETLKLVKTYE